MLGGPREENKAVKSARPRSLQPLRYGIQTAVAAYVVVIVVANTVGSTWAANLHTICPFGGVVNLYTYFVEGSYVAKLHSAVFIMLLALLIGLVLTGKSFCGWICPLGSVQQGLGGIGSRLWPGLFNKVPRRIDQGMEYLKYVVLVWVLVQTARTGRLIFEDWDPYYNLFRIWTDGIAISGYVVVAATLLAALFIPRAFSRYACPLGAFNGFFNSFSLLGIERDAETCTSCGRCDKACPVNITVSTATSVRNVECTRCLKCVEACPVNTRTGATLGVRSWMQRLRPSEGVDRRALPRTVFAGVAVAAFVLPILITNISGDFVTTGGGGGHGTGSGAGQESGEAGEESGEIDQEPGEAGEGTQSIRGRTTLAEIEGMVVDFPAFLEEFGIPETEPPDTMLRDLTEKYGFDMEEIRAYVARNGP